ncbi:HNH endonuclease [Algiphilus aromaticivorans]|uniref:HNH endonuclease n=1 Tax=Algiphilus aromaticivorans TaxID=382454 RepID=UPI000A01D220
MRSDGQVLLPLRRRHIAVHGGDVRKPAVVPSVRLGTQEIAGFWTDHKGRQWPEVRSPRRLKFKYPLHAALRAYVMHRDNYRCRKCLAAAIDVPTDYDGRSALWCGHPGDAQQLVLVLDHVLTLKAGGRSTPDNLQVLCETCNRRKQKQDKRDVLAAMGRQS